MKSNTFTSDYPYFGLQPWYAIFLQDKFLNYFTDPNTIFEIEEIGRTRLAPVFQEFAELVEGVTWGSSFGSKIFDRADSAMGNSPVVLMAYHHFMQTCPVDQQHITTVWNTMHDHYQLDPKKLCAEQIAVLIMYPFWSRMDGSFEVAFAKDGRLGKYLQILHEKTVLPTIVNERKRWYQFLKNK